jgi:hypothetical protein
MSSQTDGLKHMMESQEYKHMFLSEQHQEMTPINLGQKDRHTFSTKNTQGVKPTDSLKSFQLGLPLSSSSVS